MNAQKILRLEIENVKRISAVEIFPDGNLVVISGENSNGKSSVLESIAMLFGGKKAIPEMPIHRGKIKGHIIGETEDLIITLKFTASGGSSLVVTTKDGTPLKSPQGILDSLTSSLTFDPMKFDLMAEKEPDKALELLRKLAGLDFTALNAEQKRLYDTRTLVGREVDTLKAKVDGYTHDATAPAEEVSVAELTAKANAINETNEKHYRAVADALMVFNMSKERCFSASREMESIDAEITRLESQIADAKARRVNKVADVSSANSACADHEKHWKSLTGISAVHTDAILLEISKAEETNAKVRSNNRRKELVEQHSAKSQDYDKLTDAIDAIDKSKAEQLEKAKFPMPEISFSDSGVLLAGVPWGQGSTAERIRASIAIGAALNPALRVILVRNGNDISSKSMELVSAEATRLGLQCWVERIAEDKHTSVIIEDGKVKA